MQTKKELDELNFRKEPSLKKPEVNTLPEQNNIMSNTKHEFNTTENRISFHKEVKKEKSILKKIALKSTNIIIFVVSELAFAFCMMSLSDTLKNHHHNLLSSVVANIWFYLCLGVPGLLSTNIFKKWYLKRIEKSNFKKLFFFSKK